MEKEYFKTEEEKNQIIERLKEQGKKAFIIGFDNIRY